MAQYSLRTLGNDLCQKTSAGLKPINNLQNIEIIYVILSYT